MAYTKSEAADLIIKAGLKLVEKGLIARTWGNISARISDTEFLITPSGMAYDSLTPEKLVVCKIEDCSYEGSIKPSSEKGVHGEAYKYRSDIHFVIHTHQLYATAVGSAGLSVSGRNEQERALLGAEVPVAKYAISSTKPLKKNVSACIQAHPDCNAFFMRYHGVLALGKDYENAFEVAETLEDICKDITEAQSGISAQSKVGFAHLSLTMKEAEENLPEAGTKNDFMAEEQKIRDAVRNRCGYTHVLFDVSPAVCAVSENGKTVKPMIDDMAQIAGASFACVAPGGDDLAGRIARGLKKNAVVFVKGLGAVCAASAEDEAEAVTMVLEKNCLAAVYCASRGNFDHLKAPDAMLQRFIYVKKYSKLK